MNQPHDEIRFETVLDESGRYVQRGKVVTVTPSDNFKGVRVIDFTIDHLQEIGAEKMLQECGKFGDRTFKDMDKISEQLDNFEFPQVEENTPVE